jgi:hypothetical protein
MCPLLRIAHDLIVMLLGALFCFIFLFNEICTSTITPFSGFSYLLSCADLKGKLEIRELRENERFICSTLYAYERTEMIGIGGA